MSQDTKGLVVSDAERIAYAKAAFHRLAVHCLPGKDGKGDLYRDVQRQALKSITNEAAIGNAGTGLVMHTNYKERLNVFLEELCENIRVFVDTASVACESQADLTFAVKEWDNDDRVTGPRAMREIAGHAKPTSFGQKCRNYVNNG